MQACWLVRNGVPFDVAFAIGESGPRGEAEALAMSVVFGEFEGGEFDWGAWRWRPRDG